MQDLITKGTGNSRFMKSAIPEDITFAEMVKMLRDGTFPFDLNGLNPAGIEQTGTPYNKEQVLTDDTAALLRLDSVAANVNAAFATLAENKVNIQTGFYVGDGESGEAHPKEITCDFVPRIVLIYTDDIVGVAGTPRFSTVFFYNAQRVIDLAKSTSADLTIIWDGNKLKWYANSGEGEGQLNAVYDTGDTKIPVTYHWVAIG